LDPRITSDWCCSGKYFEKLFEPLEKMIFPVGIGWRDEREAFGAVNYAVLCAVTRDRKKGKDVFGNGLSRVDGLGSRSEGVEGRG